MTTLEDLQRAAEEAENPRTRELAAGLITVRDRIARAAEASGRSDTPELIVVTKYFPARDVELLSQLGVTDVGENKDQEASAKAAEVLAEGPLRWHFIGQLQSNKAKSVVRYADWVHSVDRMKLVTGLDRAVEQHAPDRPSALNCLIQLDLRRKDHQDGRGGADPADLLPLAEAITEARQLHLGGVMAVAPLGVDPAPAFARLAELSAALTAQHPQATVISAGMSQDLEDAVAHGATHLRVGRDVLGPRPEHR